MVCCGVGGEVTGAGGATTPVGGVGGNDIVPSFFRRLDRCQGCSCGFGWNVILLVLVVYLFLLSVYDLGLRPKSRLREELLWLYREPLMFLLLHTSCIFLLASA